MTTLTTADKFAMYVGGGLVLLGVVGIGLLEMFLGAPHPVSGDGQIEHEALVPLALRSGIILTGLGVWGLTAIYKLVGRPPNAGRARESAEGVAD